MICEIKQVRRADALRYMGHLGAPDERMSSLIDECESELLKTARPQFVWRAFDIVREEGAPVLSGCDFSLSGEDIAKHLGGCEKTAVICATLSADTDRLLRRLEVGDSARALITDALASAMTEQVSELAINDVLANMEGFCATWCYGAGYGDFPLETAPLLLSAVDAGRRIGVYCTEGSTMTPRKSIVGVVGLSCGELNRTLRSCENCSARGSCKFSKQGTHC